MTRRDVEELVEPGETVEAEIEAGTALFVVTNRRLLAFTPGGGGKNYRAIELPNVEGASVTTRSNRGWLAWAGTALVVGVAFVALSRWLDFGGVTAGTGRGASALGVGGPMETINRWLGMVDDAFLALGAIGLLGAVVAAALYVTSRETVLSVGIAGESDVTVPAKNLPEVDDTVRRIRAALGQGPKHVTRSGTDGGGDGSEGDDGDEDTWTVE